MYEFDYHKLSEKAKQNEVDIFKQHCADVLKPIGRQQISISYLIGEYTEQHRHYHTIKHINYMFKIAEQRKIRLQKEEALAIIYHDIVYFPGRDNNEELSALALKSLKPLANQDIINRASEIIRQTAFSMDTLDNPVSPIVLDLDLAGFAEPNYELFVSQNKAVEAEFSCPIEDRTRFLRSLLKKTKFYYSMNDLEERAQNNIYMYINSLIGD